MAADIQANLPTSCNWCSDPERPDLRNHPNGREHEPAPEPHEARRGDDVEAWIKRHRDQAAADGDDDTHYVLDNLLDTYRLHADTGTPLDSTEDMGPRAPGEV